MTKPIYTGTDWDIETIYALHDECAIIATEELGLDTYHNQFEIISSSQMLDAYASTGMPLMYGHWSFGKRFVSEEKKYREGQSGLAYEMVLNSDPCINYLMEENTATTQATVIAHAAFGHNHFFKNNYLFQEWTHADSIVDYLNFAKEYIAKCEEKYGLREVEKILDSCHALQMNGVDRFKRPPQVSAEEERSRALDKEVYLQRQVNPLFDSMIEKKQRLSSTRFPEEPEENILKFIEKHSPVLEEWQRELVRIVRMVGQYFHPQRQTKVSNEGFACWTHLYIMNRLYDKGLIEEGSMLEFFHTHSGVVMQPTFDKPYYSGFNPYTLGLAIYNDIERICKNPTEEDKEWFPDLIGKNYIDAVKDAVANYRDESFIQQYLSPKVMRDFRMFRLVDDGDHYYQVSSIHDNHGYKEIRRTLARSYDVARTDPNIQVYNANLNGGRTLELHHYTVDGKLLKHETAMECMRHIKRLWGFNPVLISFDEDGNDVDEFIL